MVPRRSRSAMRRGVPCMSFILFEAPQPRVAAPSDRPTDRATDRPTFLFFFPSEFLHCGRRMTDGPARSSSPPPRVAVVHALCVWNDVNEKAFFEQDGQPNHSHTQRPTSSHRSFLRFSSLPSASLIVYRLYLSLNDKSDFEMPNIVGRSVQSSRASSVGTGP